MSLICLVINYSQAVQFSSHLGVVSLSLGLGSVTMNCRKKLCDKKLWYIK